MRDPRTALAIRLQQRVEYALRRRRERMDRNRITILTEQANCSPELAPRRIDLRDQLDRRFI